MESDSEDELGSIAATPSEESWFLPSLLGSQGQGSQPEETPGSGFLHNQKEYRVNGEALKTFHSPLNHSGSVPLPVAWQRTWSVCVPEHLCPTDDSCALIVATLRGAFLERILKEEWDTCPCGGNVVVKIFPWTIREGHRGTPTPDSPPYADLLREPVIEGDTFQKERPSSSFNVWDLREMAEQARRSSSLWTFETSFHGEKEYTVRSLVETRDLGAIGNTEGFLGNASFRETQESICVPAHRCGTKLPCLELAATLTENASLGRKGQQQTIGRECAYWYFPGTLNSASGMNDPREQPFREMRSFVDHSKGHHCPAVFHESGIYQIHFRVVARKLPMDRVWTKEFDLIGHDCWNPTGICSENAPIVERLEQDIKSDFKRLNAGSQFADYDIIVNHENPIRVSGLLRRQSPSQSSDKHS
jgi:hypothetical protein